MTKRSVHWVVHDIRNEGKEKWDEGSSQNCQIRAREGVNGIPSIDSATHSITRLSKLRTKKVLRFLQMSFIDGTQVMVIITMLRQIQLGPYIIKNVPYLHTTNTATMCCQ